MNALTLVFVSLCVFAIAYRYYGLFIATKVLGLNTKNKTPAVTVADGIDYVKTNKYVLFGHHFAAIAAAGPLLGPVLAAQFGYLPGALWIIVGCVLGGAVHDMVVLFASVRHNGQSLAEIAETEVGKGIGMVAAIAILFILLLTLAGLSIAVVNAMFSSPWGTFVVFATMPIAFLMGIYLHVWREGDVLGASIIGVVLLFAAVVAGPYVVANPTLSAIFTLTKNQISVIIPIYGFVASVLPVWMLLCPRDYLSTYLKLGTIAMLAGGIIFMHPELQMPAVTSFINGGGPVIPGKVFPFLFITIACGAISGFHAIIGSGTTPKMIGSERDILFIGYGAMLTEGFVAIMALIAACVLVPADYFAINSAPAAFQKLAMDVVNLPTLSAEVGETLQGRPGGAVSLAVGMAYVFDSVPFMKGLMAYWYHFAIMFESVFILTAVDTGTRVGRFFLQEMIGHYIPKFNEKRWMPGIISTSLLFTGRLGLSGVHRRHHHHLAALRHEQPTARLERPDHQDHHAHPHEKEQICSDHGRAGDHPRGDHDVGRLRQYRGQLSAQGELPAGRPLRDHHDPDGDCLRGHLPEVDPTPAHGRHGHRRVRRKGSRDGSQVKAKGGAMFTKILFPTDFSETSWKAMDYIKQLKQNGLNEVVVLHVTDGYTLGKIEPFIQNDLFQQIKSKIYRETREVLQAMERELKAGGFNVKVVTRSGHPIQEILKLEEEEDVSGVVMGSHDASWMENLFGGSVAEAVVHKSKRPVLVVKH